MSETTHQSLYQKYRPHSFEDVVGQDFIKKVLMNSCRNHTLHHGYIFFGFHGTGKTTLARIFAQTVNCTNILPDGNPCEKCENCLAFANKRMMDVIEIDAASYTGVENIREVIEHAKFTPSQGKYKIYIIDEVHMLSKWAFNALLKTLEEPPPHVIFLLATTEINKVPDTILSRVIRFDLERINDTDMRWLLEKICKKEGIKIEPGALDLIIHRSRWSLRDSLTILEKCILDKTLTQAYVESALQLVGPDFLAKTLDACISWDGYKIQEVFEVIQKTGVNVRTFAGQMTEWIANHIEEALAKKQFPLYKSVFDRFTRIYVESKQVSVPMDVLTMSLCECITKNSEAIHYYKTQEYKELSSPDTAPTPDMPKRIPKNEDDLTESSDEWEIILTEEVIEIPAILEGISTIDPQENASFSKEFFLQKLIERGIKQNLLPLLRTADIDLTDGIITIKTTSFAETRCREGNHWNMIETVGYALGAKKVEIVLLINETLTNTKSESPTDIAEEIFG